tara:strand:- start:2035 stop:2391 length:357 start_codon:yes stop_codon:yes gene_type:complete
MARRTTRKTTPKSTPKSGGKKKSTSTSKARSKSKDTISPYYAARKYGTSTEKAAAKKSMANYFSGKSPANTRKETEGQHMSRMAKRDTIPSARKSRGTYQASALGFGGSSKKTSKKKR